MTDIEIRAAALRAATDITVAMVAGMSTPRDRSVAMQDILRLAERYETYIREGRRHD